MAAEQQRDYLFSRVFNFRDVGGLVGHHGQRVRHRRLFRSDSLSNLTEDDRQAFAALGVRTVLDLRRPSEIERDGRAPRWDGLAYRHIHPEHQEWGRKDAEIELAHYLCHRYLDLAETGAAGLAEAVAVIADARNAPVVVHCVAGKDRTGIVCALTLASLGVSDDEIAAEYSLSTAGMQRYLDWIRQRHPERTGGYWLPLESPAEAMTMFLAGLRERHGSIDGYLRDAGLDNGAVKALRAHLLEPGG